jgi:mono/diheme cytochrome c family protein
MVASNVANLVEAADATRGKKLYEEEHCGGCHGTQSKPPAKFPNLFTSDWSSAKLEEGFNTIKNGESPMPAYGDKLSDNQIADLLRYFRSGE